MPEITFLPANITVEIPAGASLSEGARGAGIFFETPCGGKGACKKCGVKIIVGGATEEALICRAVAGDKPATVVFPYAGGDGRFEDFDDPATYIKNLIEEIIFNKNVDAGSPLKKIKLNVPAPMPLDGFSDADRFINAVKKAAGCNNVYLPLDFLSELPDKLRENDGTVEINYFYDGGDISCVNFFTGKSCGIAVDIGTTTIAVWLVDLRDGSVLSARSAYNKQTEFGLDIISRINSAKKSLGELKERVLSSINDLIFLICNDAGIKPGEIVCASVAGNTTMVHLLLGINPEYIRLYPYTPAVLDVQIYSAGDIGITVNKNAPVYIAPSVGSYVGGDITAGLLCAGVANGIRETSLFIDIGTNGEIALSGDGFIFACACSAGPAFEGGGIKCGTRAQTGAIERINITETGTEIRTIGGAPAIGICGSGIISAVAELFKNKIIDRAGRFAEKNFIYNLIGDIYICEADINNFIRAKGAIFSACQTLLDNIGLSFDDLDRVYVAGGFGRFLDLDDARTVGLLPRLPDEKFIFLGNTSAAGAYLTLISDERRNKMREIANSITYVDLSGEPSYMDKYTASLFLPHTDAELFS